jgi:hypothetical protein
MIAMILSLLALTLFPLFAQSAEPVGPETCRFPGVVTQGDFSLVKETPAGTIRICGEGTAEKMHGELYLEKEGKVERVPETEAGALGYLAEAYGPFATGYVALKETRDGIEVTELLPFEKDRYVPGLKRKVQCGAKGCKAVKAGCAFKRPKGKVDAAALRRLKKAWENPGLAQKMAAVQASIQQEMGAYAGKPSGEAAKKEASREEFDDDVMAVYRNALLGHRPSQKLLLDAKQMKRLDDGQDEQTEGAPHRMVNSALLRLKAAGCLR